MRIAATKAAAGRRGRPGWRSVTWLVLLAFTLQAFVTQTHIHGLPRTATGATIGTVLTSESGQHKAPIDNDATGCPFCQAIVHAGAFFAPVAPLLLLPVVWTAGAAIAPIPIAVVSPPPHSWQSRAPPQL